MSIETHTGTTLYDSTAHEVREPHSEYVPYEYLTVHAERDLEPLYADTYRSFGWEVEAVPGVFSGGTPGPHTVALKLKRDRRVRALPEINKLQRTAEDALSAIVATEKSRDSAPLVASLTVGLVGCGFLAGSVFAITADNWGLSIPLGIIGLAAWLGGYLVHGRVKANKAAKTNPLIDEQYEIIYASCTQAAALLV